MTQDNWINIAIAMINLIVVVVIADWHVRIAKQIANPSQKVEKGIISRIEAWFISHLEILIIVIVIQSSYIVYKFVGSTGIPSRVDIVSVCFNITIAFFSFSFLFISKILKGIDHIFEKFLCPMCKENKNKSLNQPINADGNNGCGPTG